MLDVDNPSVLAELKAAFDAGRSVQLTRQRHPGVEPYVLVTAPRLYATAPAGTKGSKATPRSAQFRYQVAPSISVAGCNVRITTFGRDFGVAYAEYVPFGSDMNGRSEPDLGTDGLTAGRSSPLDVSFGI